MPPMDKPATNEEARDAMQRFITGYSKLSPHDNFDNAFNRCMRVTSATLETDTTSASATFHFTIPALYGNNPSGKTIHGGAVATFFDNTTSLPMLAVRKWWDGESGVTRNLNVSYFRPVLEREKMVLEAEVVQCGKRNATIKGVLRRDRDGVIVASCQHDKVRAESKEFFKL